MRLLFRCFPFILVLCFSVETIAQDDNYPFTVQVGSFINPKPTDFTKIQSLGFVYAINRPSGNVDVFIGGYANESEADRVVQTLKANGYGNSSVSRLNVEGGKMVSIIQLGTKTVGDNIAWDELMQAGEIYLILSGTQIKLATGIFSDAESARQQLANIKNLGYGGAFVKTINNTLLHKAGDFETGGATKKPLIPLDFSAKPATEEVKTAEAVVKSVPAPKAEPVLTAKGAATPPPAVVVNEIKKEAPKEVIKTRSTPAPEVKNNSPAIRAKVKRTSAIELQKVLKAEGIYKGSLDGFYGKGTRSAYDVALNTNKQLGKYRILARYMAKPVDNTPRGTLQYFINNLWEDPNSALKGLESSKAPVAKAYRAYFKFVNDGTGPEVNQLMNEAINEVFANKKVSFAKFDPSSTYAYVDLNQLLLHTRYIHEVSVEKPSVPCWVFRKHSAAALSAFEPQTNGSASDLRVQNCGGFWEWEEVQLLNSITSDISAKSKSGNAPGYSMLSQLFLTPKAISTADRKALEVWNNNLWKGINGWASRDPFFGELSTALKISYFQSQVLFEDYFMDLGFSEINAKGLALAAMKALVGNDLERFI